MSHRLNTLAKQVRPHLQPNEQIMAAVLGQYETKRLGHDSLKTGALFATDQRLLFFAKRLTGFDLEHFPYQNVSSFEMGKKFMGHYVSFYASGNEVRLKWIKAGNIAELSSFVRSRMASNSASAAPEADALAQLERLGALRDQGVLTQHEFEIKKRELLAKL